MKKLLILLIIPLLSFWGCSPKYYTPQSMFEDGKNPNEYRNEGDYHHELRKTKKEENYIPQIIKKEEIIKKIIEDYVPQTQRKSLIMPPIDPNFIGTWVSHNPDNSEELVVIKLASNHTATSYEIDSGIKSVPVTFTWFHKNNKLGYLLFEVPLYSYTYPPDIDYAFENTEFFYDELLNDLGVEYEWINNTKLKLFIDLKDDEGPIVFNKQNQTY